MEELDNCQAFLLRCYKTGALLPLFVKETYFILFYSSQIQYQVQLFKH